METEGESVSDVTKGLELTVNACCGHHSEQFGVMIWWECGFEFNQGLAEPFGEIGLGPGKEHEHQEGANV
jgi:hypothetical protein